MKNKPTSGWLSVAYFGNRTLSAEQLEKLWTEGSWVRPCPGACDGGLLYVNTLAGSPLSGSGTATGVCTVCGEQSFRAAQVGGVGRLFSSANDLLRIKALEGNFSILGSDEHKSTPEK